MSSFLHEFILLVNLHRKHITVCKKIFLSCIYGIAKYCQRFLKMSEIFRYFPKLDFLYKKRFKKHVLIYISFLIKFFIDNSYHLLNILKRNKGGISKLSTFSTSCSTTVWNYLLEILFIYLLKKSLIPYLCSIKGRITSFG